MIPSCKSRTRSLKKALWFLMTMKYPTPSHSVLGSIIYSKEFMWLGSCASNTFVWLLWVLVAAALCNTRTFVFTFRDHCYHASSEHCSSKLARCRSEVHPADFTQPSVVPDWDEALWIPPTPHLYTPSITGSPEAARLQLWLPLTTPLGASTDCFGVPPLAQIGGNYGLKEV